jgi:hypothetical protein
MDEERGDVRVMGDGSRRRASNPARRESQGPTVESKLLALGEKLVNGNETETRSRLIAEVQRLMGEGTWQVLQAALDGAVSEEVGTALMGVVEGCCESASVMTGGMKLRSSLFCIPIIVGFGQPVGNIHFERMMEEVELSGALSKQPFCGCDSIGCFLVMPRFWPVHLLMTIGMERLRQEAMVFPTRRSQRVEAWNREPKACADAGRHSRVFLRYLVGHVVDMEKRSGEVMKATEEAIARIQMAIREILPAGEIKQVKCKGNFFDNLRTGMWVYQNERLAEEARVAARAAMRTGINDDGISATVTTTVRGSKPHHQVGLFVGNKLWRGQAIVLAGRPFESPGRSAERVETILRSWETSTVKRFRADLNSKKFAGARLLDVSGRAIEQAIMIAY